MLDDSLLQYLRFFEVNIEMKTKSLEFSSLPLQLKENDLGIICASNHAMGLLTNAGPQSWHPAHDETKEQGRKAAEYCKERGIELGKLSMYYSSQLKGPATFLVGVHSEEQLRTNLEAFRSGLTEEEQAALEYLLKKYGNNPRFPWQKEFE